LDIQIAAEGEYGSENPFLFPPLYRKYTFNWFREAKMIDVFPKKIDMKAAQYELQRMIDAFLDLAEEILEERKQSGNLEPVQEPKVQSRRQT
jgi:hypothetical protein